MASARQGPAPRGLSQAQVEAILFANSDNEEDDLDDLYDSIPDIDSDSEDDEPPPQPRIREKFEKPTVRPGYYYCL